MLAGKTPNIKMYQNKSTMNESEEQEDGNKIEKLLERRKSFRKVASTTLMDDCMKNAIEVTDPELLDKLGSISPISREVNKNKMLQ